MYRKKINPFFKKKLLNYKKALITYSKSILAFAAIVVIPIRE